MPYLQALAAVQACGQRSASTSITIVLSAPSLRASVLDSNMWFFLQFARKHESPLLVTKSQSLTALPGSTYTPPTSYAQHSHFGSFSSLHQSIPSHSSGMGAGRVIMTCMPSPGASRGFCGCKQERCSQSFGLVQFVIFHVLRKDILKSYIATSLR